MYLSAIKALVAIPFCNIFLIWLSVLKECAIKGLSDDLDKKPFENSVVKAEIAGNWHFFLFQRYFVSVC